MTVPKAPFDSTISPVWYCQITRLVLSNSGECKKNWNALKKILRSRDFIRFNYMIPVPKDELEEFTVNDEGDLQYKILMQSELQYIRANREKIELVWKMILKKRKNYGIKEKQ